MRGYACGRRMWACPSLHAATTAACMFSMKAHSARVNAVSGDGAAQAVAVGCTLDGQGVRLTATAKDVAAAKGKLRLDAFVSSRMPDLSRTKAQTAVAQGCVLVNGVVSTKPGAGLQAGDDVLVAALPPPPPLQAIPEAIPLDVVFEDEYLLVVNKAAGMVVHISAGHHSGTLVNALLHRCGLPGQPLDQLPSGSQGGQQQADAQQHQWQQQPRQQQQAADSVPGAFGQPGRGNGESPEAKEDDGTEDEEEEGEAALLPGLWQPGPGQQGHGSEPGVLRPGIVHRLDKGTSGLLVVAKQEVAHRELCAQFKARTVGREYVSLALGCPGKRSGRVETNIDRDPNDRKRMAALAYGAGRGRTAASNYAVQEVLASGGACLMRWKLDTGRTHQIRVHAKHLGHPLLGDDTYGGTAATAATSIARGKPSRQQAVRELVTQLGSGALSGSVGSLPSLANHVVYVQGTQVIIAPEDAWATAAGQQRCLRGHDTNISAFALSRSGLLMATGNGGQNSDACLWDVASGTVKARFQEHDIGIMQLAFSLDQRLLLTIGHEKDQKLFVLDTSTGKIVTKQVLPPKTTATASAWAPSQGQSYMFAFATQGGEIQIFTLDPFSGMASGTKVTSGSLRRVFTCMVFSADGQWLYVGTTSGDIVTVNVARRSMQMAHPACGAGVGAMCLTSTGRLLVGGGDGSLTLFSNDHMWRDIRPFASAPGPITSISPNADGSALILGTANGGIHRLALGSSTSVPLHQAHFGSVRGAAVAAGDPSGLVTCSDDGTVCLWALGNTSQVPPFSQLQVCKAETPHAGSALCVATTGDTILSGWADGVVRAHARGGGAAPTWVIPGAHALSHSVGVTAIKLSHRTGFMMTGGAGGEVRAWDLRSREMASNMKLHTAPISDLAVLSDDAHVMVASEDRSLSLWDLRQEACKCTWRINTKLTGMSVCQDQVTVLTSCQDRRVVVWDIRAPNPTREFPGAHALEVTAISAAPAGPSFATGGADGVVKVWDLGSGAVMASGSAHTGPVSKVVWPTPAGPGAPQPLASVALDGSVACWQLGSA